MAAHAGAIMPANSITRRCLRRERVLIDRENPLEIYSDTKLRKKFRFHRHEIIYILNMIDDELQFDNPKETSIPPLIQLCTTLRFLATGAFYDLVTDAVRSMSESSLCRCVHRVCEAIEAHKKEWVCLDLTEPAVSHLKDGFFRVRGIPDCIGVIDCTHVEVSSPSHIDEPDYVNRKHNHTINVQMICDANYRITNSVVKMPGRAHDGRVFRKSRIGRALKYGPHIGFLLADSGYHTQHYIVPPFADADTVSRTNFNNAHKRTRVIIEMTFGQLKERFFCLERGLRMTPERSLPVIESCIILHNIARKLRNPYPNEEPINPEATPVYTYDVDNSPSEQLRDFIAEVYF